MSRRHIAVLLGAFTLAGALVANAYVSLHSIDVLRQGFDNEERPAEVQRTLLGVLSAVQDAETGQRGYLLTGDPAYLVPYANARARADSLTGRLDTLVSWNALQVRRMPGLRAALDAKFTDLDETIRLYDEDTPRASLEVVQTGRGRRLMDDVRERIATMLSEARRVRTMFADRARDAVQTAQRAAWAATVGLAGLLLLLGFGVRAAARRRERHAAGLAEANAALSTALGERQAALSRVRAMQAQLVQQEKLAGMGRLTAGVAHEIKNPLNFVTNFAALTVELGADAAEAMTQGDYDEAAYLVGAIQQNASKIQQHGLRAADIVQSMLVHARGVTGERRPVAVGDLVETAVTQAVGPDGTGRIDLTVRVEPEVGEGEFVAESVIRALRNLIDNAIHAVRMRDAGGDPTYAPTVTVHAREGRDHDGRDAVVLTVADNGAGIPDDLFPRIFEPFFTTKGPGSGTGLGLSLAHDIAVGHGGTLLAERPTDGGCAFVMTLPRHVPDASA